MKRSFSYALIAGAMTFGGYAPASADEVSDQIGSCRLAMQAVAATAMEDVSFDFKSRGGAAKKKRLQFTMRHGDDWGVARCIIVKTDVREIQWPREFREELGKSSDADVILASLADDQPS